MNIFAHTAPGLDPPFLSVNLVADGVEIIIRGSMIDGRQSCVSITLSAGEFAALQRAAIPAAAK